MNSIWILLVTVALANAVQLKVGPQTLETPSTKSKEQPSQKRFANDEVVLYLTPSQIKSLQTDESSTIGKDESKAENQDQRSPQVPYLDDDYLRQQLLQFSLTPEQTVTPVDQQMVETETASTPQNDAQQQTTTISTENPFASLSNTYVSFYPSLHIQETRPSLYYQQKNKEIQQLQQDEDDVNPLSSSGNYIQSVPYQQHPEHNEAEEQQILELSDQLQRVLNQNRAQLKTIPSQPLEASSQIPQSNEQQSWYSNQKSSEELEKLFRERQEFNRRTAIYRAEANAKLLYEVPQPYSVPIEFIRTIPTTGVQNEKDVNKPDPAKIEKRVPVAVTKTVYVNDRPYFIDRVPFDAEKDTPIEIPLRKAEKFSILRHLW